MKILLSSYACEPDRGSEAEIGWGIALELAKNHQVWVLTRANNTPVHTAYFDGLVGGKPDNLNFIYYDLPKWASFYKQKGKRFLLYYYHWQFMSYFACKPLFTAQNIDVVHHLTGGMDFFPSGLSFFNAPFVWGPVGGEDTHPVILENLPLKDKLQEYKRIFLRAIFRYFDPFTYFTRNRADHVITYSTPSAVSSQKYYQSIRHKVSCGIQTGLILDARYQKRKSDFSRGDVFTVFYAANLIPWKGARFVVEAFVKLCLKDKVNARLVIVGSGPLKSDMKAVIFKAGLQDKVEFKGWLSMQELIDLMPQYDVFLYPTFHHGLANICLQTMVMGLPLVCLECDGVETALAHGGGLSVSIDSYEEIPEGLANAVYRLYQDEPLRRKLSQEAQTAVIDHFNYSVLAEDLLPAYDSAITSFNKG